MDTTQPHSYSRVPDQPSVPVPDLTWKRPNPISDNCRLKGPLRLVRLCLLGVVVPGLLIAVPLYLRYRVFSQHLVPLSMSDMRLLDNKMSTTWCQRQVITSNATFNAYLLSQRPQIRKSPNFVKMSREIVLEDDMKEYWGFYLLQGSTVKVASCARRAGASLIVIRGHHHLHQCAYIGDNSSEEEEEANEIQNGDKGEKKQEERKYSNRVLLQKVRPEVNFFGNVSGPIREGALISRELDMKEHTDEFDMPQMEAHRANTRTGSKLSGSLKPRAHLTPPPSSEVFKAVIQQLKTYEKQGKNVMQEVNKKLGPDQATLHWLQKLLKANASSDGKNVAPIGRGKEQLEDEDEDEDEGRRRRHTQLMHEIQQQFNIHDENSNNAEEEGVEHEEVRGTINGTTANDTSNSEFWSSFSSSEERLLECEGLILSQPMTPSASCQPYAPPQLLESATSQHRISYTVPGNGYYFFVFSSENEIQPNFIRAEFELEKMLYDVSESVAACHNSTGQCVLPLNFFSQERLVLELPVNDSLWNSEFLVVSTCEPRTALYIACVVAVPVLILLCAF